MEEQKKYPLLQAQYGVFVQCLRDPGSVQYNLPTITKVPKEVDLDRLEATLHTVIATRKVLRTRFYIDADGNAYQTCDPTMNIPVRRRTCTGQEAREYLAEHYVTPFNILSGEPLIRFEILETDEDFNYLLIMAHHCIMDGLSFSPCMNHVDLPNAYAGVPLTEDVFTMYDAAEEEAASFASPAYQRAKQYYAEKLAGLSFATLTTAGEDRVGALARHSAYIDRQQVDAWCAEHGTQPNLLFQAAFSHVIAALTRQQKVLYYSVTHGRLDKRIRPTYGMYIKTIPVVADVRPDGTVMDLIRAMKQENFSAIRNIAYPMNHLCMDLHLIPGVSFNFLAQESREENFSLGGHVCQAVQPERKSTFDDMDCAIYLTAEAYDIRVESSEKVNSLATVRMVSEAVLATVCQMMQHPDALMKDIPVVSDAQADTLLARGRGEARPYDTSRTFVALLADVVGRTPDAVAVTDAVGSMTYRALDHASNVIAAHVMKAAPSDAPSPFVGIMLDTRKEFVAAAIGVQKAGMAYVPMDVAYPIDRLQHMLCDSESTVLITTRYLYQQKTLEGDLAAPAVLFVEDLLTDDAVAPSIDLSQPDAPAYMIYTSGSTGKPKGVVIPHRAKSHFVQFIADEWHLTPQSRICCHSSFSFDASVEDLYPVLTVGGTLFIVPEAARKDMGLLRQFIVEHAITGGCYTTQLGIMLLQMYPDLPVDYLVVGGEKMACNPPCGCRLINTYGPTEFTVDATYFTLSATDNAADIPIGRPLHNLQAVLLDANLNPVPWGATGELCLSGPQMAAGYWHRPDLTAEKFVEVKVADRVLKVYRTGDLARWRHDGQLEYKGRIDNQVKLRGFRIELGEVEAQLSRYPGVSMVSVQVKEVAGAQHLVAYFTAAHQVNTSLLHDFLSGQLTEYMVPSLYMQLPHMPLTPNGKVDVRALPMPHVASSRLMAAPDNEQEQQILELAQRITGLSDFGVTDNLYDVGMTSLMSMQFVAMAQRLGYKFRVADLMRHRTIRAVLSHQNTICWWFDAYDPAKPVLVLVHGIVVTQAMMPKLEALCPHFNILCFEPTDQHFELLFADDNQQEAVELYSLMLEFNLPADARVLAFWGFSWGGELAYLVGQRYAMQTGTRPVMFLGDSHLDKELFFSPESQAVLKALIDRYAGTANAEIAERKARIVAKMQDASIVMPAYEGHAVLFNALKSATSPRNVVNIQRWKALIADLEVIDMDCDHEEMSLDPSLTTFFTEHILRLTQ